MKSTKIKQCTMFVMIGFLVVFTTVCEAKQEPKTLKLIQTYHSLEEVEATYPGLFPKKTIEDKKDSITFYDPQAKKIIKRLEKQWFGNF